MAMVEVAQETLDISLMFGTGIMVGFFELGVFDKGFAVLAPVFWLERRLVMKEKVIRAGEENELWISSILTFCCSDQT